MEFEECIDRAASLVDRLEAADRGYRDGSPTMSDAEFDALEAQLAEMSSGTHPFLHRIRDDAPDIYEVAAEQLAEHRKERDFRKGERKVGMLAALAEGYGGAGQNAVGNFLREMSLTIAMGSQRKALGPDHPDLARFVREAGEEVLFWSDKEDGLSAEVTYDESVLSRVLTRGDGKIGADITATAWHIPSLPKRLPDPSAGVTVVRGEILMPRENLAAVNAALAEAGRRPISNVRNGAVGIVKAIKNAQLARFLDFRAFNILFPD